MEVRPPLSKTSFPVSRVGEKKKKPVERSGIFFLYKLECTGGGGEFKKNREKKVRVGPV